MVIVGLMLSLSLFLPSEVLAEKKSLTFLGAPVGSDAYNFISAMSDIIRKNHPELRCSVVETMGGVEMMKAMADLSDDKKQTHVAHGVGAILSLARLGRGPFGKGKPIKGWRVLFTMYNVNPHFMTLDSKIRSGKDLIGKRIGFPPKGHGLAKDAEFILGKCWGILDKVKVINMPMDMQKDALLDGTVDAVCAGGMYFSENEFKVSPNNEVILAAKKNVYYVGVTKEEYKTARAKDPNSPLIWRPVKANALRAGYPDRDNGIMTQANVVYVWHNMDAKTVYEIVKVLSDNSHKVKEYFAGGKAFFTEAFVMNPWSEKLYHPGALKFLKEKGLTPQGTME